MLFQGLQHSFQDLQVHFVDLPHSGNDLLLSSYLLYLLWFLFSNVMLLGLGVRTMELAQLVLGPQ